MTANKLEFKGCVIGDSLYGIAESFMHNAVDEQLKRMITKRSGGRGMNFEFSVPSFSLVKDMIAQKNLKGKELNLEIKSKSGHESLIIKYQRDLVEHYLINLAVNQTCFVDRSKIRVKDQEHIIEKNIELFSDEVRLNNEQVSIPESNHDLEDTDLIQYKVNIRFIIRVKTLMRLSSWIQLEI